MYVCMYVCVRERFIYNVTESSITVFDKPLHTDREDEDSQ